MFQEDFLDLTVAVKNVSGLEDALWNMYVEEEVFDYDNLYHCGTCDRLVKAAKVKTDTCLLLGAPSALGSTKVCQVKPTCVRKCGGYTGSP